MNIYDSDLFSFFLKESSYCVLENCNVIISLDIVYYNKLAPYQQAEKNLGNKVLQFFPEIRSYGIPLFESTFSIYLIH